MRVSSSKRPQRAGSALPIIFVTLLALNFFIFVVNVWVFLPKPADKSISVPIRQKKPHQPDPSAQKKPHRPDPSAAALREAIYNTRDKVIPYDAVPKILHQSDYFHGVVPHLPSIPARRRMIPNTTPQNGDPYVPLDAVNNLDYFLGSREKETEEHQPLYLYNPMLLPLDDQVLSSTILDGLSIDQNHAAYIGVYRVSNFANCHGPGLGVPKTYSNFLGLALLDQELNVVKDPVSGQYLDAVIDINRHLWEARWTPTRRHKMHRRPKQFMQDCQIIPARSGEREKSTQLVLICNEYGTPIQLKLSSSTSSTPDENEDNFISFTNMYGNGLQLIAQQQPNMILYAGKNLHYFSNNNQSFLEIWPGGPHEVAVIDFTKYPYVDREGMTGFEQIEQIKALKTEPNATFITKTDVKLYNNRTMLIGRDSGSTCCVKIKWKAHDSDKERELLLGFSHRKTMQNPKYYAYSYVSRVYAFEPNAPFDIVARSGFFCLGFATDNEKNVSQNEQVRGAADKHKLKLWQQVFVDCPRIHFVTGITEKYGDEETVIISYGVNDCYPRMIEVSKEFLVSLLKPL